MKLAAGWLPCAECSQYVAAWISVDRPFVKRLQQTNALGVSPPQRVLDPTISEGSPFPDTMHVPRLRQAARCAGLLRQALPASATARPDRAAPIHPEARRAIGVAQGAHARRRRMRHLAVLAWRGARIRAHLCGREAANWRPALSANLRTGRRRHPNMRRLTVAEKGMRGAFRRTICAGQRTPRTKLIASPTAQRTGARGTAGRS